MSYGQGRLVGLFFFVIILMTLREISQFWLWFWQLGIVISHSLYSHIWISYPAVNGFITDQPEDSFSKAFSAGYWLFQSRPWLDWVQSTKNSSNWFESLQISLTDHSDFESPNPDQDDIILNKTDLILMKTD